MYTFLNKYHQVEHKYRNFALYFLTKTVVRGETEGETLNNRLTVLN